MNIFPDFPSNEMAGRAPHAPTTPMKTDMSPSGRLPGRWRGDRPVALPSQSLESFIAGFKSITTKRINEIRNTPGVPVWQRNYNEHVIDNDEELQRVRRYIEDNPINWDSAQS
jgi:putative transposase